jgi:hypothetical protein
MFDKIFKRLDFTDTIEAPAPTIPMDSEMTSTAVMLLDEAFGSIDWENESLEAMTSNVLSPARCVLTTSSSTPVAPLYAQTVSDARVCYMKKCREVNRLKAFPVKKDLVFPTTNTFTPTKDVKTIQAAVNGHMISYGLAWLNAQDSESIQNGTPHVAERLVEALYDHYDTEGAHLIYSLQDGFQGAKSRVPGVAFEELYDYCIERAAYVYDKWDPEFAARLSALGAKGGKKSKRGKKIGRADWEAVDGYSQREQAEMLGVSRRTVARYRAEAAA